MTKEDCCASNAAAATAYSEEDLDSGSLFFWRVLGGGVQCRPCRGKRIFNFICFYLNFLKKKKSKDSCRSICRVQISVYAFFAKFKYSKVCKIVLKKRIVEYLKYNNSIETIFLDRKLHGSKV